ncbi:MAG: hypothetical protein AB4080_04750 [Trichodesmium sp.]
MFHGTSLLSFGCNVVTAVVLCLNFPTVRLTAHDGLEFFCLNKQFFHPGLEFMLLALELFELLFVSFLLLL